MRAADVAAPVAVTLVVAALVAAGCRRDAAAPELPRPEATAVESTPPAAMDRSEPPAVPPTLADLDRRVTWIDRPVRDARTAARELDARAPPDCTVAEALALQNDSPETNALILGALGRPPAPGARPAVDRVVRHLATDVDSLNPILAETSAEFDLLGLVGVDLFGFDRALEPFANADVVTSWRSSSDGLVDRVELRDDLTWSDGMRITARDVAFTWRLVVDPRVPARAFRGGVSRIRAVEAYDDRTVVFFHEEPLATTAWNIDFPVLPRHVYARTWERDPTLVGSSEHAAVEARPVTGGPYEVAGRTPGREIVLRRRAGWSSVRGRQVREPFPLVEIRFRVIEDPGAALDALEAGTVDEIPLAPRQWANDTGTEAFASRAARVMMPEVRSLQFAWRVDTPLFADQRVRRAMGYAFDHGRLLEGVCHGLATPATPGLAAGSWAESRRRREPYRQDLGKAEALLDEAGWVDHDGDGLRDREIDGRIVPFAFTILCDHRPFRVEVCTLLQECLARVGVSCTVRSLEPHDVRDLLRSGAFEACLVSWGAGVDPDTAESLWCSAGARNYCGYANADVDRLFAAGRRERDRERRSETYARIQDILAEDQPCTWLVWQQDLHGFSKRLEGGWFGLRGPARWAPGLSSTWKPALD